MNLVSYGFKSIYYKLESIEILLIIHLAYITRLTVCNSRYVNVYFSYGRTVRIFLGNTLLAWLSMYTFLTDALCIRIFLGNTLLAWLSMYTFLTDALLEYSSVTHC